MHEPIPAAGRTPPFHGLRVVLLGSPEVTWDGDMLLISRRQTRALLYRLAAQAAPLTRDHLCYLFWPDVGDSTARRNLTHLLTHLRRVLPQPELLQTDDARVGLDRRNTWCDALVFDALLATAEFAARPAALRAAADLYRGPFLAGFDLPNCPEFDLWLDGERHAHERRFLDSLGAVIEIATAQADYDGALAAARRYLEVDELAEDIHRRVIALYGTLGDRTAALRQFERCAVVLERDVGVSPLAETRAVFEGVRDGQIPLPPRPRAAALLTGTTDGVESAGTGTMSHLPAPVGPLIGRVDALREIGALLEAPHVRLVTLSGAGGAGKTRLGLEVARLVVSRYTNGVTPVELAPVRDPALVIPAIAAALGLGDRSERSPLIRVQEALRDRHLLLMLDNFEHVTEAAPQVAALLAAAPHLKVLVTSRTSLHITGEHIFHVPPLALPDAGTSLAIEDLAQVDAIALFLTRVTATRQDFRLTTANAADIVGICRRLDGLPLAIELAAARAALLSPRALLARLDHQLALLTDGLLDLPERQRTLRATIDWSYELLDVGEQLLLGRLAVFAGGWTLEAAEAVSAAVGATASSALVALHALLDKHMVQRVEGVDGEPRFTMLETIREYALERLTERGELGATRQAHALWFLDLAEQVAPALHGPEQGAWFDRLEEEHANLRVALTALIDRATSAEALRLCNSLRHFWLVRGSVAEGRQWLQRALGVCQPDSDVEPRVMARARTAAAALAFHQGDLAATGQHCSVVVPLWRALVATPGQGDLEARRFLAESLGIWSAPLHLQRDDRLPAVMAELFALVPGIDDPHFQAINSIRNGQRVLEAGELGAAKQALVAGMTSFRDLGDGWSVAESLIGLGSVLLWQGDVARARTHIEEALALASTVKDRALEAWALNNLGEAARLGGDDEAALAHYTASLQRYRDVDNQIDMPRLLHNLGYVALHTGDRDLARARFAESLRAFQANGTVRGVVEAVAGLASVAAAEGRSSRAAILWGATDAIRQSQEVLVWPADRAERTRYEPTARQGAHDDAFDLAYSDGAQLTLEQAITIALTV